MSSIVRTRRWEWLGVGGCDRNLPEPPYEQFLIDHDTWFDGQSTKTTLTLEIGQHSLIYKPGTVRPSENLTLIVVPE